MDEPQAFSFFVDDLIDAPLGPGQLIVWDADEGGYVDLFYWQQHTVDDGQPPPSTADLLLTDEPLAARHRWLESQGFERDDSMSSYSHSIIPCPVCNSDGHALFARWGEGYSVPSYLDQKTLEKPSWAPTTPGAVPPSDATDDTPQEEDDFDSPPEGEPRWLRVSSIAELKELPRFIGVRNKKPLVYTPNNDRSLLKGSTFSHKPAEDSKCGGFEDDIDAETFVRKGGVCVDHVSIRKVWDSKERRFRQTTVTTPRYMSVGWHRYAEWETSLEGKSSAYGISYACGYLDAPAIVVVDVDYPKAGDAAEADRTRDMLIESLSSMGAPTCESGSGKGRRAAFSVADPDFYQRKHVAWRHASGINIELNPPGCRRHVLLYKLDGDLPELDPEVVDTALTEQGFVKDSPKEPADRYTVWGRKDLTAFMEVVDREGWALAFNEMSMTPFHNGREQDDTWIALTRAHLELNYRLKLSAEETVKFEVDEQKIRRWGLETALIRDRFHPVQEWLARMPAWDGRARIDYLLEWCLGASVLGDESAALVRTASRDIVMGLVNRAMEPGCAWPRLTILWGPQGCGKSSFLELLLPSAEGWYYESPKFPLNDEELFDNTRRKWLVEFSDPSTKRAEAESAKTFVSRKSYSYRHRYGTLSTEHPYGFHAVMTGNPMGNTIIPADASGYRRYLSVDCVKVTDYHELKRWLDTHRDQIWAEGLHRYRAGERFEELPESLHALRDAAAQSKAGNGHLDHFFEMVAGQLERGGASGGLALHELVTGFLTTWDGLEPRTPDGGRVSEFVHKNSSALAAGLKDLGLVQRKVGKSKLRRWFFAVQGS